MEAKKKLWKKSGFVGMQHLVSAPHAKRVAGRRVSRILQANQVKMSKTPVIIGPQEEKIQIKPIMENGRIKALHVTCSCGAESTFDIQYASQGEVS